MTGYRVRVEQLAHEKHVLVHQPEYDTGPVSLEAQPGYWFPHDATTVLVGANWEDAYHVLDASAVEPMPHTYKES